MFHDLDASLKSLLASEEAPSGLREAEVSFLTPEKGYAPAQNTINLFMHEVKEDRDLRDPLPIVKQVGTEFVQRLPPLRVDCAYLVTAWSSETGAGRVAAEHRLLAEAFLWLSRSPVSKGHLNNHLKGSLASQPFPPPTMVAQLDGARNTADFWTALGIPPRPCFNLVVTIAMDLGVEEIVGKPAVASKEIRLVGADSIFQIGGAVRDAASGAPLEAVELTLVELGEKAKTKADGRFTFSSLAEGDYQLRAGKDGYTAQVKPVHVPGATPAAFDIVLTTNT